MPNNIPSDMVAVFDKSQDRWWIYYITTEEPQIRILKGAVGGQPEDSKPKYEDNGFIDLETVKPEPAPRPKAGNTQIGVLEWFDETTQKSQVCCFCDTSVR